MTSELAILEKLRAIPSKQGKIKLKKLKEFQVNFFIQSLTNLANSPNYFSKCVKDIFSVVTLRLNAADISIPEEGMVVISNHLGINKLTKIYPEEINVQITNLPGIPALENNDPFTLLFAPIEKTISELIASKFNYSIIYVFMKLNNPLDEVLSSLNVATIDRTGVNQYSRLIKQVEKKIQAIRAEDKVPIIVIFPEGGTSGKETFSDPYSLINFKSGYKNLATDFKLPILPIGIKVDADMNYFAAARNFLSFHSDLENDRKYMNSLLDLPW